MLCKISVDLPGNGTGKTKKRRQKAPQLIKEKEIIAAQSSVCM
jgi:hypothetical protein